MPDVSLNVFSVDVEDYHNQLDLDFLDRVVPPDQEAVRCTDRVLELCDEFQVRGTFFILGEIAEHFPDLVRRIAERGHHLGVHGYHHHHVFRQTAREFRTSVERARKLIEDVSGHAADAYRATAFSINESTPWAVPTLIELGFRYDSSVYPFRGRRYGDPTAPRRPYQRRLPDGRWIWEVPLSTLEWGGRRWPVCGGGYLRLAPLCLTSRAIRTLDREGSGAVIYVHPYETEPHPLIRPLPGLSLRQQLHFRFFNFQQTRRRSQTLPKLRYLFKHFAFGAIPEFVQQFADHPAAVPV